MIIDYHPARQQGLYEEFMNQRDIGHDVENLDCKGIMNVASNDRRSIVLLIQVLMQLRKVCNHPDLFETRPVRSPLAMLPLTLELPATLLLWTNTPYNKDYSQYTTYGSLCLPLLEVRGDSRRRAVWSAMLAVKDTQLGDGKGQGKQYRCFLDYARDKLEMTPIGQTRRWLEDAYILEERLKHERRNRADVVYDAAATASVVNPMYGIDCIRICYIQPMYCNEDELTRALKAMCLRPYERLEKYSTTWQAFFQYVEIAVAPLPRVSFSGGHQQSERIRRYERYSPLLSRCTARVRMQRKSVFTGPSSLDQDSLAYHHVRLLRHCRFPDR